MKRTKSKSKAVLYPKLNVKRNPAAQKKKQAQASSKKTTFNKARKQNIKRNIVKKTSNVSMSSKKRTKKPINWVKRAYQAGVFLALQRKNRKAEITIQEINAYWADWLRKRRTFDYSTYHFAMRSFIRGWFAAMGKPPKKWVLLPTKKKIAAIVTVSKEEETMNPILHELHRLPLHETIVIINDSTDKTISIGNQPPNTKILYAYDQLGYKVGRALGAEESQSDMCIFLDGNYAVQAEQVVPFIQAAEQGMDVVLNDVSPFQGLFSQWDDVTRVKCFLNKVLERSDLKMNSLTSVPHVLTNHALELIGAENLSNPPVAHAIAISKGLNIGAAHSSQVFQKNQHQVHHASMQSNASEILIGDHIEALHHMLELEGARLSYVDEFRDRTKVKGIAP